MRTLLSKFTRIAARLPRAHLLIEEMIRCDLFMESQEKRSCEEKILKETSKTSGLATAHFHETLSSLDNAGTIRVSENLQGNASYKILNSDDFEALVKLESQSDNKNEFPYLDFSIRALNVKPKKLPLV